MLSMFNSAKVQHPGFADPVAAVEVSECQSQKMWVLGDLSKGTAVDTKNQAYGGQHTEVALPLAHSSACALVATNLHATIAFGSCLFVCRSCARTMGETCFSVLVQ
jgi:hypothetical protein